MATIQELAARLPASFGEQLGRVVRVAPGAEAVGLVSQSLAQLSGVLVARLPGADADQVRQVVGRFFRDYDECSDALQAGITRALGLLFEQALGGRAAAPDEVQAVAATVLELRTPQQHGQTLGVDLAESEQPHVETAAFGGRPILDRLDREEAAFADRLRGWLTARGMSQQEFADRLGVRPSAVSMMLGRKCRPQRRTVERAAHILGVSPADLWPGAAAAAPGGPSEVRRLPPDRRAAVLRAEAADAADEYRTNPALRAFDAYALEARFLDGRRLLASEVRRLPGPVRAAVLRAEAADAADEYRTNPALRAFDAARLEAGLLEVPA